MPNPTRKVTSQTVRSIVCERAYMAEDQFSGTPYFQIYLADDRSLQIEQVEENKVEVALFGEDGGCLSYKLIADISLDRHLRDLGLDILADPYRGSELERQLLDAIVTLAFDIRRPNFRFHGAANPELKAWPCLASAQKGDTHRAIDTLLDAGWITHFGYDLLPCRKRATPG